jgi:hypothetical protein
MAAPIDQIAMASIITVGGFVLVIRPTSVPNRLRGYTLIPGKARYRFVRAIMATKPTTAIATNTPLGSRASRPSA